MIQCFCIDNGIKNTGELPGGLGIKRRAPELHDNLLKNSAISHIDPLTVLDWLIYMHLLLTRKMLLVVKS